MFHVLNDTNGMKMAETETLDEAHARAILLADEHQQNYTIYELSSRGTVTPIQPRTPVSDKIAEVTLDDPA